MTTYGIDRASNITGIKSARQPKTSLNIQMKKLEASSSTVKNTTVCSIGFWKRKYNIDIQNYFVTATTASKESRLRLLHFKILHNI